MYVYVYIYVWIYIYEYIFVYVDSYIPSSPICMQLFLLLTTYGKPKPKANDGAPFVTYSSTRGRLLYFSSIMYRK